MLQQHQHQISRCGWSLLLSLFVVLAIMNTNTIHAAAQTLTITTRYTGGSMPAAIVWEGGEIVNLTLSGGPTWKTSALDGAFAATLFNEAGLPSKYGPNALESSFFPNDPGIIVFTSAEVVSLKMQPAPGFAISTDATYTADLNAAKQYLTDPNVVPPAAALQFTASPSAPGFATYSCNSTNEFDVRSYGIVIVVEIKYNVFAAEDGGTITSSDATLSNKTSWSFSFPNTYTMVATFAPRPDFQIAKGSTVTLTLDLQGTTTLLGSGSTTDPTPSTVQYTLNAVDDQPVSYCLLTKPSFSEQDLREGLVVTTVYLSPGTNVTHEEFLPPDHVVGGTTVLDLWKSAIVKPTSITDVTVDVKTNEVTLTVKAASNFDTNTELQISVNPPKTVLKSQEAGCGLFAIIIEAAQGQLTGTNVRDVTEVDINAGPISMDFSLDYDLFVLDKMQVSLDVEQLILDNVIVGGKTRGVATTILGQTTHNISSDGRTVTVTIPQTPLYNIPENMVERVTVSFKHNSTQGGLPPRPINATFNISGITPMINLTYNDGKEIAMENLWREQPPTVVQLSITGDLWDINGKPRWNVYHPLFEGAFKDQSPNHSFSTFHTPTSSAIRYQDVVIDDEDPHSAKLTIDPMKGLSLQFDERVTATDVTLLIEGPRNTNIKSTRVLLLKAQATNVHVSWSGVTGTPIKETKVREGITFAITVHYEGLDRAAVLKNPAAVFASPGSLQPYLSQLNVTIVTEVEDRGVYYKALFELPALPQYDITTRDVVELQVPNDWYVFTAAATAQRSAIRIESEPSPQCTLKNFPPEGITEGTVRSSSTLIVLELTKKLKPGISEDILNKRINFTYTSTFQNTIPLDITFREVGVFSLTGLDKIVFTLNRNTSYEIRSYDHVSIHLDRLFFVDGETCDYPVNFTVGVLPGTVTVDISSNGTEDSVREHGVNVSLSFRDDNIKGDEFNVTIDIVESGATTSNANLEGLLKDSLKVLATRVPNTTEELFTATLPPLPTYDIYTNETIKFLVPRESLVSGQIPTTTGDTLIISPSPGVLDATFNATVTETDLANGGQKIILALRFEEWKRENALMNIRDVTLQTIQDSNEIDTVTKEGLTRVFSTDAFAFQDDHTIVITLQPDFKFDSVRDMSILIQVPQNVTLSTLTPTPSELLVNITKEDGKLMISGKAVRVGSRDLVLGGQSVTLMLENDLFIKEELSPNDICPKPINETTMKPLQCDLRLVDHNDNHARILYLDFPNDADVVIDRTTRFSINVPSSAIKSGRSVNNVSMEVFVQSGVLEPVARLKDRSFTEDMFRNGLIPRIEFTVAGDRFVQQPTVVVEAIAKGFTCAPKSDAYGFCSRAASIMTSGQYSYAQDDRRFVMALQSDAEFDVFRDEVITINITGIGMVSRLSPFTVSPQTFRITPNIGSYFFSTSMTHVLSQQLAVGFVDDSSKTKHITIIVTLYGERWKSNPTRDLIDGFTSSSLIDQEANGFVKNKEHLFHGASVSDDGRVLKITMKPYALYRINNPESLIFDISGKAVMSGIKPQQSSALNTILVSPALHVSLLSPAKFSVTTFKQVGINVTLMLSPGSEWERAVMTNTVLQQSIASLSPPGAEPAGFEALKTRDTLLFVRIDRENHGTSTVEINIRIRGSTADGDASTTTAEDEDATPAPTGGGDDAYYLRKMETIRVTIPSTWVVRGGVAFPEYFDLVIDPELKTVVLMVRNPVDRVALVKNLAKFLGISTSTISIEGVTQYGDVDKLYSRVRMGFSQSSEPGERDVDDTIEVLLNSEKELTTSCCEVHYSYLASNAPSEREINEQIGLRTAERRYDRDNSLVWVWVSVSVLCLAAIVGIVWYWRNVRHAQYSGMNRAFADADTMGAKLIISNDPAFTQGRNVAMFRKDGEKIRDADFAATIDQSEMLKQVNAEREDEEGLPCFAGKSKSTTRIDVDETMKAGQPPHLFDERIFKVDVVPLVPQDPVPSAEMLAVYPPDMPYKSKFNSRLKHANRPPIDQSLI